MIDFDTYQDTASETIKPNVQGRIEYFALGLCGEAGEVAEKIKKHIRDDKLVTEDVAKELGDVLWYLSQLASCLDYKLSEVAGMNIDKLVSRKSRGVISGEGDNR